jgi:hypothetical protein
VIAKSDLSRLLALLPPPGKGKVKVGEVVGKVRERQWGRGVGGLVKERLHNHLEKAPPPPS